jgi:hypothetical protein
MAPLPNTGTNGWCLGPGNNASFFDKEIADPNFKISAINGALGWLPPDPAFAQMNGSRSWVIPWMEDDLSLASAELWVNRTLHHADLAAEYNASGLLGLMWRTWETAPQIAVLAQAGWNVSSSGGGTNSSDNGNASGNGNTNTEGKDDAFYRDFCGANFGTETAGECTQLFLSVDSFNGGNRALGTKLPRDGQRCCGGPMGADHVPDSHFLNVTGFETWLSAVAGDANRERATAWVNLFRYHRQTQVVSNVSAPWVPIPKQTFTAAQCEPDLSKAKCYVDKNTCGSSSTPYNCSILPFMAYMSRSDNSQEICALTCAKNGYTVAGVEYSVACFCGDVMPTTAELPLDQCNAMKCGLDKHEDCGGADIMYVFPFTCTPPVPTPPSPVDRARLVVEEYSKMITLLLEITTTPGELGMLASHEGGNWQSAFGG